MKGKTPLYALLCITSVLALPTISNATANGVETRGFETDVYAINMEQASDYTTFGITERIYFNNSGNSPFNGTLYSWLPQSALVLSSMCPNPAGMVVKVVDGSDLRCFSFIRLASDEDVISFTPFSEGEMLSYFGQEAFLQLNASNANGSSWHSIPINITVGLENETRTSVQGGHGVTVWADQERMDTRIRSQSVIPEMILTNQTINVTNEESWNQTIFLSVKGLPTNWTAHIYDNGSEIDNTTLQAYETKSFKLVVGLPPYKTVIEIPYRLSLEARGDIKKSMIFNKTVLYNVTEYSLWLFTNEGTDITPPADFVHWEHNQGEVDFHVIVGALEAGESMQVIIEWGEEAENLSLLVVSGIALLVVTVLLVALMMKKRKETREEDEGNGPSEARRDEILAALEEAEAAFSAGHISEKFYEDLKGKYESELKEVEETGEDPELVALKDEKQKLLRAIKEIQKKRDDGEVSESVYEKLVGDYKKRAIEIMKRLDQRKG
ncbi:MAG: hypothetical protein ACE5QF_01870 [Thermoplasmata archaeon]